MARGYRPYFGSPGVSSKQPSYVSQFTPVLHETLMKSMQKRQKKFDVGESLPAELRSMFAKMPAKTVQDRQAAAGKMGSLLKEIESTVQEDYDGDYGQAIPFIQQKITEGQSFLQPIKQDYEEYLRYSPAIGKAKMTPGNQLYFEGGVDPTEASVYEQDEEGNFKLRQTPLSYQPRVFNAPTTDRRIKTNFSDAINRTLKEQAIPGGITSVEGMDDETLFKYAASKQGPFSDTNIAEFISNDPGFKEHLKRKYEIDIDSGDQEDIDMARNIIANKVAAQTSSRRNTRAVEGRVDDDYDFEFGIGATAPLDFVSQNMVNKTEDAIKKYDRDEMENLPDNEKEELRTALKNEERIFSTIEDKINVDYSYIAKEIQEEYPDLNVNENLIRQELKERMIPQSVAGQLIRDPKKFFSEDRKELNKALAFDKNFDKALREVYKEYNNIKDNKSFLKGVSAPVVENLDFREQLTDQLLGEYGFGTGDLLNPDGTPFNPESLVENEEMDASPEEFARKGTLIPTYSINEQGDPYLLYNNPYLGQNRSIRIINRSQSDRILAGMYRAAYINFQNKLQKYGARNVSELKDPSILSEDVVNMGVSLILPSLVQKGLRKNKTIKTSIKDGKSPVYVEGDGIDYFLYKKKDDKKEYYKEDGEKIKYDERGLAGTLYNIQNNIIE